MDNTQRNQIIDQLIREAFAERKMEIVNWLNQAKREKSTVRPSILAWGNKIKAILRDGAEQNVPIPEILLRIDPLLDEQALPELIGASQVEINYISHIFERVNHIKPPQSDCVQGGRNFQGWNRLVNQGVGGTRMDPIEWLQPPFVSPPQGAVFQGGNQPVFQGSLPSCMRLPTDNAHFNFFNSH